MLFVKRADLRAFIERLQTRMFFVNFTKRSNGEARTMLCTRDFADKLAGGEPAYDFTAKDLIVVWDLQKLGFRSIPLESVKWLQIERGIIVLVQD